MHRQIKIFIELPTWLGDCVMTTPAIELMAKKYPNAKFIFFGSFASTSLFLNHPKKEKIIIDESKKSFSRFFYIFSLARSVKVDIAVSFRSSFYSKILLYFLHVKKYANFKRTKDPKHQVLKYLEIVEKTFTCKAKNQNLKLYFTPSIKTKKTLGINPGATYGSAKRWYPQYFAQVACEFADKFDIVIFGGKNEQDMANEIENILKQNGKVCQNLAGKTTIKQLCEKIASLDIFITNDSGPMHVAAAFKVPTIALFGPTKFTQTSPWQNQNAILLHKNLDCMPCMKRICPIKTHDCMKDLLPDEVIEKVKLLEV